MIVYVRHTLRFIRFISMKRIEPHTMCAYPCIICLEIAENSISNYFENDLEKHIGGKEQCKNNYCDKCRIQATCMFKVFRQIWWVRGSAYQICFKKKFKFYVMAFNLKFDSCLFVDFYRVRAWAMWNTGN